MTTLDIEEALNAYTEKEEPVAATTTEEETSSNRNKLPRESHCQKLARPRDCRWIVTSLVCAGATISLLLFLLVPRW